MNFFALELSNLSKYYKTQDKTSDPFRAVDDISMGIPKGQIVGFLGANGAGKTTTIKMICGLITPTYGTIKINGFDIKNQRSQAIANIGAVLEGNRNIFWQLSPKDNLIYFGNLKGVEKERLKKNVQKLLSELNLLERANDPVSSFSRGMQQKVAIACALIADPELILLDEPTLGLDVQSAQIIKNWIENLAKKEGKTIVLTTHQLEIAQQICDRIVIINKGKIVADKATGELLNLQQRNFYKITVAGKICKPEELMPQMSYVQDENMTVFTGAVATQEDLYKKLLILQHRDLSLVSVTPVQENLEEIFIDIIKKQESQESL